MAPTEGKVAKPERRLGSCHSTPAHTSAAAAQQYVTIHYIRQCCWV